MEFNGPDDPHHAKGVEAAEQGKHLQKRRRLDGAGEVDVAVVAASTDSARSLPVRTRFLRISVRETRSPKSTSMQIGEVGLRCKGETLQLSGFIVASMYGASPLREGPEKVLRPTGKFLDFNFRSHERSVLTLSAAAEFNVDDLALRTASDSPSRDPVNLTVEGSLDSREWQLLLDTNPGDLATPSERRAWTPWLPLRALGPAPSMLPPPNHGSGARFFCCPVSSCQSFEAKVEGYLVEGKLLNHMLREHPRSAKTQELSVRLRGCIASGSSGKSRSIKGSPADKVLEASKNISAVSSRGTRTTITDAAAAAAATIAEATGDEAGASTEAPPSWTPNAPPVTPDVRRDRNLNGSPRQPTPLPPSPRVTRRGPGQQQPRKGHQKEERLLHQQQQQQQQQQPKLSPHSTVVSGTADGSEDKEHLAPDVADEVGPGLLSSAIGMIETLPKLHPHCSRSSNSTVTDAAIPISGLDMLQRYPPIEATVEERLDINLGTGFDVRLRDNSGSVWAVFRGEAAAMFGGSGLLRGGNCVRLEGYDLIPMANSVNAETGRRHNLLVSTVHSAVRITNLNASLVSLGMLGDVAPGELVSVEADVSYLGPLRMGGPPGLEPAGAPNRALLLRDGTAACALVLNSHEAENCSSDLLGCRVRVQGTRLTDFKGKHHLSGWEHVELLQARQQQK